MPFDDDFEDKPTRPARPWGGDPSSTLRVPRIVLEDAVPHWNATAQRYEWFVSGPNWAGTNPPLAIIPDEMMALMKRLLKYTQFMTKAGAMAALEIVVLTMEEPCTGTQTRSG